MKTAFIAIVVLLPLTAILSVRADAACDQLAGRLIAKQLRPEIENLDCAVLKKAGIDKKGHKLVGICYESNGPISHIRIDTHLNCHTSPRAVIMSSISENVTVEAEARGSDCHVDYVKVKPSGALGKALAAAFNADGKARGALQRGLTDACGK